MFHILICPFPGKTEAEAPGPAWPLSTRAYGVYTPQSTHLAGTMEPKSQPCSPHPSIREKTGGAGCAAPLPTGLGWMGWSHPRATESGSEGWMEAPLSRSPNQFKTEHLMWSKKNADRRPSLGWQRESREKGKRQRSRCKAETGRIFWAKESYLHLLFTKQLQIGLEKAVWRLLGLTSCSQRAVDYLKDSVCLTLATSVPLFRLLFFKSILFT